MNYFSSTGLKKSFLCFGFLFFSSVLFAQTDSISAVEEIQKFRQVLDADYKNPKESPLGVTKAAHFEGHHFHQINLNYRVIAKAEKISKPSSFFMQTTTDRKPEYRKLYKLSFVLRDTLCELYAYQSVDLSKQEEYKDYLFLPFTDKSNGFTSYGGGRYIDLRIPDGDSLIIDFNQSYNPYCAYSGRFSCPVPPKENALPVTIEAGILAPEPH